MLPATTDNLDVVFGALKAIENAATFAEAEDAFSAFLRAYGVKTFAAAHLTDPGRTDRHDRNWFNITNWPEEWMSIWVDSGMLRHDPVGGLALRSTVPFSWSEAYARGTEEGRRMMDMGRDFGPSDGFAIPIHRPGHVPGCVTLETGPDPLPPDAYPSLVFVAHAAFSRLERLAGLDLPPPVSPLTPRETECLKWIVGGKTDAEIGIILSISTATASDHAKSILKKMGSTNRTMAASRAVALGYITAF